MQDQITAAFAELNQQMIESDQAWARSKIDGFNDFMAQGPKLCDEWQRFGRKIEWFGSKAMIKMLTYGSLESRLENMRKNTEAQIAKRDAQIIKALAKKGISEIPAFELRHTSDGREGFFSVAGHHVTIRTIFAGGYNIQRLHMRTLVKVS